MNSVNLIGRLVADPAIYGKGDKLVAKYTIAVYRTKEETDFIRVVCFKGGAEFAEKNLKKGMKIGISGNIITGSYEDEEGEHHYTTEVVARSHYFCESKKEEEEEEEEEETKTKYKKRR